MTGTQLIKAVSKATDFDKGDIEAVFDALTKVVSEELLSSENSKVVIPGVVTIKRAWKAPLPERMGFNPATQRKEMLQPKPGAWKLKAKPDSNLLVKE